MNIDNDFLTILKAFKDKINDSLHVADIVKVLEIKGREYKCQLINSPDVNIYARSLIDLDVQVNDICLVVYTDKDTRGNFKRLEKPLPVENDKDYHSINYGIILGNAGGSSSSGVEDVKVNGTSVVTDNVANVIVPTYENKTASQGGTDVSLVTTGEKYTWNNKAEVSDISNPNLLINSNFAINQRGQASYTTTGSKKPTVDRVVTNRSVIEPQSSFGIKINVATGQTNPYIQQTIENVNSLVGEYLTLSANIDGVVYTQTTTTVPSANSTTPYYNQNFTWGSYNMNLQLTRYNISTGDVLQVTLTIANPNNTIINWWKLEVGQKSTTYIPPLIVEELVKCQRYFRKEGVSGRQTNYGIGYTYNSTTIWLAIDNLNGMRITPTITAENLANFRLVTNTGLGSGLVPTAITYNIGSIQFTVSGATPYAYYGIFDGASNKNGIIYLDAEMY